MSRHAHARTRSPRAPARRRPARPSGCRAGCTAAASSPRSRSWSCATAPGWPRSCVRDGSRAAAGGDARRGGRYGDRQPAGAGRRRGHRRRWSRALTEPADTPAVELWRPKLDAGLPTLLDHAATTWRHPRQRAVWELAAASLHGFRATLDAAGFTEVHSPKLVESATECGANVFEVDYFGRPAYLAQSPQFYKQMLVGVFERVYEVGPVFRAEPHDTVRHLAEYVSLDVELGFIEDHREVIACLRDVVAGMVAGDPRAGRRRGRAARPHVPRGARGAPDRCTSARRSRSPARPPTSPTWRRRTSARWASGRWPSTAATSWSCRATRPRTGRSTATPTPTTRTGRARFDLIFRGLELVAVRSGCTATTTTSRTLEERGYPYEPYASYVEAFRRGIPPHGGFAIGLERWVARLAGAANIREVTLFPRDLHRLAP